MKIDNVAKSIILNASGHVLLMRRAWNDDRRPGEWDFPGGGVEEDESPVAAAVREVKEETGITLKVDAMRLIYTVTQLSHGKSINRFVYAVSLSDEQTPQLSHEHVEYQWLPIQEALREFPHPVYATALRYAVDNGLLELH